MNKRNQLAFIQKELKSTSARVTYGFFLNRKTKDYPTIFSIVFQFYASPIEEGYDENTQIRLIRRYDRIIKSFIPSTVKRTYVTFKLKENPLLLNNTFYGEIEITCDLNEKIKRITDKHMVIVAEKLIEEFENKVVINNNFINIRINQK